MRHVCSTYLLILKVKETSQNFSEVTNPKLNWLLKGLFLPYMKLFRPQNLFAKLPYFEITSSSHAFLRYLFFFLTAWQALGKGLWVQPSQDVGPWEKLLAVCFVVTGSKLTWMMKSWMEKYLMDNFPTSYSHRISVWIYSSQVQGQLPEWTYEPNSNRRRFWRHCRGRVMAPNHRPTTRCSSSLLAAPLERLHSRRLPTSY